MARGGGRLLEFSKEDTVIFIKRRREEFAICMVAVSLCWPGLVVS